MEGPIPLCLGCGAVAPIEQKQCALCRHAFESPRPYGPVASDQTQWALVQTSFECRACGHRSPLNHLDVDGTVLCQSCGIEQRFERQQWWDALDHAHAVADGIAPPFAEHQHDDDQRLELRAAPGWPLCNTCRSPLAVKVRDDQGLTVHCATCRKDRTYALPRKLSQRAARLLGIIGDEHELGQKEAQLSEENGVSALRCPTCGAGLTATGASLITCNYCSTSCRVHPRARPKNNHGTAAASPFWLLFQAPSRAREKLDKQRLHASQRAAKADAKDAQREAQQRSANQRLARQPQARRSKRMTWRDWLLGSGLVLGTLLLAGWMARLETERERKAEEQRQALVDAGRRRAMEAAAVKEPPRKSAGEPYAFSAQLDSVKVEGQPVALGEPCVVAVEGTGDEIAHVLVQCQKAVLYDSTTQVAGMRMLAFELYRSTPSAPPDGLRYSDTGQRANGSEVSIDTRLNQAAAWSQVVPIFRVELGPHREKLKSKKPGSKPQKPANP